MAFIFYEIFYKIIHFASINGMLIYHCELCWLFTIFMSPYIKLHIMKKNETPKTLKGAISLIVDPMDPVAWKLLMLFQAASEDGCSIKEIAKEFGYTREHFHVIKKAYEEEGSQGLQDSPQGPKTNYRRTDKIEKQIILHRFLDPEASSEVIAQKMKQTGHSISQRSVERTINDYGLQKKGYIKQIRKSKKLG